MKTYVLVNDVGGLWEQLDVYSERNLF